MEDVIGWSKCATGVQGAEPPVGVARGRSPLDQVKGEQPLWVVKGEALQLPQYFTHLSPSWQCSAILQLLYKNYSFYHIVQYRSQMLARTLICTFGFAITILNFFPNASFNLNNHKWPPWLGNASSINNETRLLGYPEVLDAQHFEFFGFEFCTMTQQLCIRKLKFKNKLVAPIFEPGTAG